MEKITNMDIFLLHYSIRIFKIKVTEKIGVALQFLRKTLANLQINLRKKWKP